jgi:hypothetical protein
MTTWNRTKGATYFPENVLITSYGDPLDLAALTVKVYIVNAGDASDVLANNVTTGITVHPTQTFTASASTDLITKVAHGVKEGQQVVLSSAGTLPAGLSASTPYFAVDVGQNDFGLALRAGGAKIDITGAGTGIHSFYIVGSLQVDLQSTWVDAVGTFKVYLNIYSGSEFATVPHDENGILLYVTSPPGAWVECKMAARAGGSASRRNLRPYR